jgi:hypothetical protein
MSAGTPITSVRIPRQLLFDCECYLSERDANPVVTPWSLTDLIVVALREKMDKVKRGRRKARAGARDLDQSAEATAEIVANHFAQLTDDRGGM